MSVPLAGKFQDHYEVLGIKSQADADTVKDAYTTLSAKYGASSPDADREKFEAVTLAFEVLSDPAARKVFDELRAGPAKEPEAHFAADEFFQMLEVETIRRKAILCLLYDRRRQDPIRPALSFRQVESLIASTSDEIQFSVWYLKQKGYAASDDKSNMQITVPGIDFLDQNPPAREEIARLIKETAVPDLAALALAVRHGSPFPAPPAPREDPGASVIREKEGQALPAAAPNAAPQGKPPAKTTQGGGGVRQTLNLPKRTIIIPPRAGS